MAPRIPSAFQYVSGKLRRLLAISGVIGQTCGSNLLIKPHAQITTIVSASARSIQPSRSRVWATEPNSSITSR